MLLQTRSFELQVAALLTNRVPVVQGGAEVLELSAKDTKTLYYMPTGGVRRLTLSAIKELEKVSRAASRIVAQSRGVRWLPCCFFL